MAPISTRFIRLAVDGRGGVAPASPHPALPEPWRRVSMLLSGFAKAAIRFPDKSMCWHLSFAACGAGCKSASATVALSALVLCCTPTGTNAVSQTGQAGLEMSNQKVEGSVYRPKYFAEGHNLRLDAYSYESVPPSPRNIPQSAAVNRATHEWIVRQARIMTACLRPFDGKRF